jgi:hypothetical protein
MAHLSSRMERRADTRCRATLNGNADRDLQAKVAEAIARAEGKQVRVFIEEV